MTSKAKLALVATFIAAICTVLVWSHSALMADAAPGPTSITTHLKANQGVGVGFGLLAEGESTLTIILRGPDNPNRKISYSEVHNISGEYIWLPDSTEEPTVIVEQTEGEPKVDIDIVAKAHIYKVVGVTPNTGDAVWFSGKLTEESSGGGKGGKSNPPTFTASVADLDIDVDSLALHTDDHWPPSADNDDEEDAREDTSTGGLYLPPSIHTGTFPTLWANISDAAKAKYKTLRIKLRTEWAGPPTPEFVGTLTLNVTAPGVALYTDVIHKDSSGNQYAVCEKVAESGTSSAIPVPPAGLSQSCYIVTNENFTESGGIEATFKWNDGTGTNTPDLRGNVLYYDAIDRVRLVPAWVDLDVDSNNNGTIDFTVAEDLIEDWDESTSSTRVPGKYVPTNWRDKNHNAIPDVADGYNRDGVAQSSDEQNTAETFTPLALQVSDELCNNPDAYVRIRYDLSDPDPDPNGTGGVTTETVARWDSQLLPDRVIYKLPSGDTKRIRIWTVQGNVARNPAKLQDGGHIIDPDHYYRPAELGLVAGERTYFYIEGARDSTAIGDTPIKAEVGLSGSSSPPAASVVCSDRVVVTVGSPMLLFDTDRDNEIRFGDDDAKDMSDYTHPDPDSSDTYAYDRTKNYRFWVNEGRTQEVSAPFDYYTSNPAADQETNQTEVAGGTVNCTDNSVNTLRDLQNFSRLQIRLPAYITSDNIMFYKITVSASGWSSGAAIRMFQAQQANRAYLYGESVAALQENSANYENRPILAIGSAETEIDRSYFTASPSSNTFSRTAMFVFEGVQAGRGTVTVKLYDVFDSSSPKFIAQDCQWLCLDHITKFYEAYTLGGDAHEDPNDSVHGSPAYSVYPGSPPFPAPLGDRPWESDYTLAVHGYNVDDFDKTDWFAATLAKRLWHVGYRGRIGVLYWPDHTQGTATLQNLDPIQDFNRSEYNAWRASNGLRKLLRDLNSVHDQAYNNKIVLYCHSQGNVVGHQALMPRKTFTFSGTVTGQGETNILVSFNVVKTPHQSGTDDANTRQLYRAESGANPTLPTYQYETDQSVLLSIPAVPAGATSAADCATLLAGLWNQQTNTSGVRAIVEQNNPNRVQFFVQHEGKDYNMPLETLAVSAVPNGITCTEGYSDDKLVKKLVSTQAAVPASAFDSKVQMTSFNGYVWLFNVPIFGIRYSQQCQFPGMPDVYGRYPMYRWQDENGEPTQRPYFKVLESQNNSSNFYRFFNPVDYATQNCWEADQAAKPADWGLGDDLFNDYYYRYYDLTEHFYYHTEQADTWLQFPRDSMKTFSYAAQGRMSLGSGSFNTGLYAAGNEYGMGPNTSYGMDDKHIFHSAQFNMNLAWHPVGSKGLCWVYWRKMLEDAAAIGTARLLPEAP